MKTLNIHLVLKEEMLGTGSNNPDIQADFISSKAPTVKQMDEELEAMETFDLEKGKTVFSRNEDGNPIMWDYQIKGFFKDACGMLRTLPNTKSLSLKNYKKKIDGLVFVEPRKIEIQIPEGGEIGSCQRPLRAQTMQGERVALANSETVPAGSALDFQVLVLDDTNVKMVTEWLNYGAMRGLGQWRNSGKGKFLYTATDADTGEVVASTIR